MSKLVIIRGLPGAGKTTVAKKWVVEEPERRARVNRDGLRKMMYNTYGLAPNETAVTVASHASIKELLKRGVDVVCDDTNLPNRTVRELKKIAESVRAEFEVWDMTNISLERVLLQNEQRQFTPKYVHPSVIEDKYNRYIKGKSYPLPVVEPQESSSLEAYVPPSGKPLAYIVDIDGTIALRGTRDPYDETRVSEDKPNDSVVETILALDVVGYRLLFVSGRSDSCYEETRQWISENIFGEPYDIKQFSLWMRKTGDTRKDSIVKYEIFNEHIRYNYNVLGVFDDRKQVVEMWRSIGLTVFQVDEGDF